MIRLSILLAFLAGCSDSGSDPVVSCYPATLTEAGYTYTFIYNTNNRLEQMVVTPQGSSVGVTYTYTYDSKGNIISRSANGSPAETTYSYDANNRLIQTVNFNTVTNYAYNPSGQLISEVSSSTGVFPAPTTYTYPNTTTRNPSTKARPYANIIENYVYEYDNKVNPEKFLDRPSLATDNNVTKVTWNSGNYTFSRTYTYEYNDKGYPVSSTEVTVCSCGSTETKTATATYNCK